jgi:hypothetical protein
VRTTIDAGQTVVMGTARRTDGHEVAAAIIGSGELHRAANNDVSRSQGEFREKAGLRGGKGRIKKY